MIKQASVPIAAGKSHPAVLHAAVIREKIPGSGKGERWIYSRQALSRHWEGCSGSATARRFIEARKYVSRPMKEFARSLKPTYLDRLPAGRSGLGYDDESERTLGYEVIDISPRRLTLRSLGLFWSIFLQPSLKCVLICRDCFLARRGPAGRTIRSSIYKG